MPIFPLNQYPKLEYRKGSGKRWFGSSRNNDRKHAACDLIAEAGSPVFAVASGIVLNKHYFYDGTYALVVHHTFFVVRYGEIDKKLPDGVQIGFPVVEGQHIANVGKLKTSGNSMLHFEMYQGTEIGELTQRSNKNNYKYVPAANYQRRADLLDPTPYLEDWKLKTYFDGGSMEGTDVPGF